MKKELIQEYTMRITQASRTELIVIMSEIILKACNPDPAQRWSDPALMGQALVNYMQKNAVNDTPLIVEEPVSVEDIVAAVDTQIIDGVSDETIVVDIAEASNTEDEAPESDAAEVTDVISMDATQRIDETLLQEDAKTGSCITDDTQVVSIVSETDSDSDAPADNTDSMNQNEEDEAPVTADDSNVPSVDEYDNLSFLDDMDLPDEDTLADVSDDIAEILSQVEALTAHEVPDPVIAPEAIEIKIPDPIVDEEPAEDEENASEDEALDSPEANLEEESEEEMPYVPKKKRTGLIICVVLAILVALAAGAYFF